MTFQEITSQFAIEDQDGCDYIRDNGAFAIQCRGHYTVEELEAKLAQLRDANRFFQAWRHSTQ